MKITHLFNRLAWATLLCWSALIAPMQMVAIEAEQSEPPSQQKNLQDIVRFGGNVVVGPNETCNDLVVVLGSVTMNGTACKDVVVVLGNLTINGEAQGDVVNILGSTKVGPTAQIKGDLVTVMGSQSIHPTAQVQGDRVDVSPGTMVPDLSSVGDYFHQGLGRARPLAPALRWTWVFCGIALLFYVLLTLVFQRPITNCAKALETRPVASLVTGLLAFVFTGPLMLLLVISFVGILVIPFILCALVVLVLFGKAAIYQFTGLQIGKNAKVEALQHPLLALAIGFVIFSLLYMVPIVGLLVWGILIPMSLGCALLALFGGFKREHAEVRPMPIPPVPPAYVPPAGSTPPVQEPPAQNAPPSPTENLNVVIPPGIPPLTPPSSSTTMPGTPADQGAPSSAASVPPSAPNPQSTIPPFTTPTAVPEASHLEMAALPRATLMQRAAAIALDFVLMAIILNYLHIDHWLLIWLGYHIAMWAWKGTTVGGVVMGLKVVRQNGRSIDASVAAVRCLGAILSTAALGLGFFRIAWADDKLSWHDQIAGTMVVHMPKGVPLISI